MTTEPGKKAPEEAQKEFRQAKKTKNLSCQGSAIIKDLRDELDVLGAFARVALVVTDGSYCNRNVLRNKPDRVEIVARTRGDITLFALPTSEQLVGRGRRRKYGNELPKPNEMRKDDTNFPWLDAEIFGAGRLHNLRYKVVAPVLWKSGAKARPLRLIIIAPLGYRLWKKSPTLYRDPAYLLTTDLTTPVETLIQAYFDRWEIEVNHREEKSMFGVGEAGPTRTENYHRLPKWRSQTEHRPSIEDILTRMREEIVDRGISHSATGGQRASRPKRMPKAS